MKLIIAEKPSLARNIAAGIGKNPVRRDGYLECGDYLISWAFGHLFSLADVEAYSDPPASSEGRRWTMDNLPCFPKVFRYELRKGDDRRPDAGVEKQYRVIEALCNRPDVDEVINAGDADREGEIIVRTCVRNAYWVYAFVPLHSYVRITDNANGTTPLTTALIPQPKIISMAFLLTNDPDPMAFVKSMMRIAAITDKYRYSYA